MYRSLFLTLMFVVANGCRAVPEEETGGNVGHDLDSVRQTDTGDTGNADTTETTPAVDCGFVFAEANGDDVETESRAVFSSPLGSLTIEVRQGESVVYPFTVTALACGGIDFNMANFVAYDMAEGAWLQAVNDAEVLMELTNVTDGIDYQQDTTHSLDDQEGIGLFYTWYDCVTGEVVNDTCGNMATVPVTAGDHKDFAFTFAATSFIPIGTQIVLGIHDPMWTDVTTGNTVWDFMADQGLKVNVTVVE